MGRSLRSKVRWVYAGVVVLVLGLVLAQYIALSTIETRLQQGDVVAELLQDSLEMRRFEKKFYGSGEHGDLAAARDHAEAALERVRENEAALAQHARPGELDELQAVLELYRTGLGRYPGLAGERREQLVESIRNAGGEASALTKVLSQRERENLRTGVQVSRTELLLATSIVLVLVLLGGWWLARRILAPLRSVEDQLRAIGAGSRRRLTAPNQDRELVSFTHAFNAMLDELDARSQDLRRSERLAALGVLVSGVAHELNNPLGNISTALQLVAEEGRGGDPALLEEWLQQAEGETARAQNIVRGLLMYSRQQPRSPKREECRSLKTILDGALDLIRATLPADQVTMRVDDALQVTVDPERLQQVFVNLLRNAFEAGGDDVEVHIEAQRGRLADLRPGPGGHVVGDLVVHGQDLTPVVRISIDDDGPGIPDAALDHVFEPFYRGRDEGSGSGLGLFVAQEIVQDHGGAIGVSRCPMGGTRFQVWLPCECGDRA
ncbi:MULTISPECIES: sensor histidine kinase [Thioalkalivibrio]|uniref:sensor histidine kinase n=1 Tax=Thioalkalivibrio TaxID=106633 RepID=UPI000366D61E|nr:MULTISPECIES: HAMP domain-containing sensor histidine kinase [Thioalkalivibrio]OOC50791.1 two-component sensor histidine kinase [Thioalkalivibrio versutus]